MSWLPGSVSSRCTPSESQKRARGGELRAARALGDVAAQDHGVGPLRLGQRLQGGDHGLLLGAEVGVGDVQQDRHCRGNRSPGGGSITCSGRGDTVKRTGISIHCTSPSWPPAGGARCARPP
jgi:hypothetical protein